MSAEPDPPPPTRRHIAVLRYRPLTLWIASRFASGTAATLMRTVLAWQLFQITKSELALGVLGVIQFIPALLTSLVGGAAADFARALPDDLRARYFGD